MTKKYNIPSILLLASLLFGLLGCQTTSNALLNTPSSTEQFLIGTYTKNGSEGVYKVTLDTESQTLSNNGLAATSSNPSYLAVSNKKNWLFAATDNQSGGIDSFEWDKKSSTYTLKQQINKLGKGTCHISLNPQETQLALANYTSSDVYIFDIDPVTKTLTQKNHFKNEGAGPHKRQDKSHMHNVQWDKSGHFLYAVDLGTDEVLAFDTRGSDFTPIVAAKLTSGNGPRHLAFHPYKPFVYVLNELTNSLSTFEQDSQTGKLILKHNVSALETPTKNNTSSAIKVSADGRFIYAGVRRINEIAVFKLAPDGSSAKLIQSHPSLGNWPRDINLSTNQQYLLIANQKSNTIKVLKRNIKTGLLSSTAMTVDISTPSYIGSLK